MKKNLSMKSLPKIWTSPSFSVMKWGENFGKAAPPSNLSDFNETLHKGSTPSKDVHEEN